MLTYTRHAQLSERIPKRLLGLHIVLCDVGCGLGWAGLGWAAGAGVMCGGEWGAAKQSPAPHLLTCFSSSRPTIF